MEKKHYILKLFMPFLSIIYLVLVMLLAALPLKTDSFVLSERLMSTLIEFGIAILTIFISLKIMPELFSNCKNYKTKLLSFSGVIAILLIVPFITIIEYDVIYNVKILDSSEKYEILPFACDSVFEELICCISAVLLAPVNEELSFRYLSLTPFNKKISQLIVMILVSVIFAHLHNNNFLPIFVNSIIFGLVFIFTKNILCSILFHSFSNLSIFIFGILTKYNITDIKYISNTKILIFSGKTQFVFGILFLVGLIILCFSGKAKVKKAQGHV